MSNGTVTWTQIGNIRGPEGPQGVPGPPGGPGGPGSPGPPGLTPAPTKVLWLWGGAGIQQVYTPTQGCRALWVQCWAGGGGGAAAYATRPDTYESSAGGGGGGGAYAASYFDEVKASYQYVIGTGGTTNTDGGNTWFDAPNILQADGGQAGSPAFGIGSYNVSTGWALGGQIAYCAGQYKLEGQWGGAATRSMTYGPQWVMHGGEGGNSPIFGGGTGQRWLLGGGTSASAPGGGGSGAVAYGDTGGINPPGGPGYQGVIIVTEYF